MMIKGVANYLAKSRNFVRSSYKEWAKICLYLVKKYGVFNENDLDLCKAIMEYDKELLKMLNESKIVTNYYEIGDIISDYDWEMTEEQKQNRAQIKGEFNV